MMLGFAAFAFVEPSYITYKLVKMSRTDTNYPTSTFRQFLITGEVHRIEDCAELSDFYRHCRCCDSADSARVGEKIAEELRQRSNHMHHFFHLSSTCITFHSWRAPCSMFYHVFAGMKRIFLKLKQREPADGNLVNPTDADSNSADTAVVHTNGGQSQHVVTNGEALDARRAHGHNPLVTIKEGAVAIKEEIDDYTKPLCIVL